MRKVALVFVLAVFVPSLVLAWLAVRSLRDQQFVLERQQALLIQGVTDSLARDIEEFLGQKQLEFSRQVEALLTSRPAPEIAASFDERLRTNWPLAQIGFVVTVNGDILSPPVTRLEARQFLTANGTFLANRESAEIYWNPSKQVGYNIGNVPAPANTFNNADVSSSSWKTEPSQKPSGSQNYFLNSAPQGQAKTRSVSPRQAEETTLSKEAGQRFESSPEQQSFSKIAPAEAEFQQLVREVDDGMLARFVDNKLTVLFWHRSSENPRYIFGAQLALPQLIAELGGLLQNLEPSWREDICVAVLDDSAKPVALSHPDFLANWKQPFVATEIGEGLPHWEIAAYLLNPEKLTQSAQTLKLTLGLLIATLVLAIGVGSWLIVNDLNRQLTLARQKTDFVSNVSHELKTPLTSIRMFSELLAEQRVSDPAKQRSYLNIITAETARLTRLINNVLDFSRLERNEKKYNLRDSDLVSIARDTVESYRPHLENNGFVLECVWPATALPVRADTDAIAQVIVNLLSNAEKYSDGKKKIQVEAARREGPLPCAEVKVLDRGLGVPRGSEEKIFEQFYRAHDSLSSGIQGSGLGLTLARQIARAHGGEVAYESRSGGGSCFCLRLPLKMN